MAAALPKIDQCPRCGKALWFYYGPDPTWIAWTFWTDGKDTAELREPHAGHLRKCSVCREYFFEKTLSWEEALVALDLLEGSRSGFAESSHTAPTSARGEAKSPSLSDIYASLIVLSRELTSEQEVMLRLQAWRLENEEVRMIKQPETHPLSKAEVHFSLVAVASMKRLFDLLDENKESHRFYRAEIARELGVFDEAIALFDPNRFGQLRLYAARARQLAEHRDRYVANLEV